jgi:hypothetical protein
MLKPPEMMDFGKEIKEDLNANPEENSSHFIAVLVEALFVLRKILLCRRKPPTCCKSLTSFIT